MKKNSQGGFTLIELLVVIAIIGILASVVLASLNTARNKGADAKIKAELANARAQAELFYDTGQTYLGVCASGTNTINSLVQSAATTASAGTIIINGASTIAATSAVCNVTATTGAAWLAQVPLKVQDVAGAGSGQDYYCVDSTGASRVVTAQVTAGTVVACLAS